MARCFNPANSPAGNKTYGVCLMLQSTLSGILSTRATGSSKNDPPPNQL